MLANRHVYPTIPAADLARAEAWYKEKLGLSPKSTTPAGAIYELGAGTGFLLYPTGNAGQAPNTLMTFESQDVRADVDALKARGVAFESYDMPGLKTEDGVARIGKGEAAWFRDSEGNILALGTRQ